jgi:ATP-dependent Clp protease ATP-binding subunit ClpC
MEINPNFSPKAQFFIKQSKKLASSLNDPVVKEDHLLLIILQSGDSFITSFLTNHGVDIYDYIDFVTNFSSIGKSNFVDIDLEYSPDFKKALNESIAFSQKIKDQYVGPEHLFFALINNSKGSTFNFISSIGVEPQTFIKDYINLLRLQDLALNFIMPKDGEKDPLNMGNMSGPMMMPMGPQEGKSLESYCVNLNELAIKKKIHKVIGRDDEIQRMCEVLARKNKNNPMLIGDPGVGKTACVEGLASLIVSPQCPRCLSGKELYAVDLASMIAGTKYRGQFEQRIKNLIDEVTDKDIILFIDEAHTIIGAGGAEGAMDAANILKPALARGSIKLIAATTYPEYKKVIEKDSAFSRRFENIFINEPSPSATRKILTGIKKSYEKFHDVVYTPECLDHIIEGASLYLPTSYFPDKAIDIMDECGAKLSLKNSQPPQEIIDLEESLYDDHVLEKGEEETNKLLDKYEELTRNWERSIDTFVSVNDVNLVLSQKSKVPIENIFPDTFFNFKKLEQSISKIVIGQNDAISSICNSIARSKIGLKDFKKPIGSFLFLGSTGTGKTYCAKTLAKKYFGDENNFIRFDMSEFTEKVSASKLIGASPGYVGYEEGGALIEKIRKQPHSIILFDEIEKSHKDVQQLLLQILEEGEIEDNIGRKAYFNNTIIILTSNIGAHLFDKTNLGFSSVSDSDKEDKIKDEAIKILSPELYNRLDEVVVFNTLSRQNVREILRIKIKSLASKLKKQNIGLHLTEEAQVFLCDKSEDSKMGARPIDRVLKRYIENKICEEYIKVENPNLVIFNFDIEKDELICELK